MNFINPGLAWFALAGLIPIIIHLLNKQRYKRIRWAAMEFLLEALKKTRRRLQIENLLLLIIRILILVLLALALSRCYFIQTPLSALGTRDTHAIIALDNSYSMGYRIGPKTSFAQAKKIAYDIIDGLKPAQGDKLSILTLSDHPQKIVTETSVKLDMVKKDLVDLSVSDYGTDIYKTLLQAKDIIQKSVSSRKVLYIITDCQRVAWQVPEDEKQEFVELLTQISQTAEVKIIDMGKPDAENTLISRIESSTRVISTGTNINFLVEVTNYSQHNLPSVTINFFVDGLKTNSTRVTVNAYNSTTVSFAYEFIQPGPHRVKAELDPDRLEIDNQRLWSLDVKEAVQVLLVNGEPSPTVLDDEITFLKFALHPSREEWERVSIYKLDSVSDIVFEETDLKKYDLIILANLEYLSAERAKMLEDYISQGGGVLILLGDKVDRRFYNETLYKKGQGILPGELIEVKGDPAHESTVKLTKIDFNHPALKFFARIKETLTTMHIYEYYRMEVDPKQIDVRVLARYSDVDETPAIVEKRLGKGKVIVVTTSADTEWNLMPGRPGYLMLYDQMVLYLVTSAIEVRNLLVGHPLKLMLKAAEYAQHFTLATPRAGMTSLSPIPLKGEGFSLYYSDTVQHGLYILKRSDEESLKRGTPEVFCYFAVNLNPAEGDLRRISEDELRQLYPNFNCEWVSHLLEKRAEVVTKPPASNIWKYLIYAVLGLLILETILAQRFGAFKK